MKLFELLDLINLSDLITLKCGADAAHGLSWERGGVIRDPRPGYSETRPSFSVYKHSGRWYWKRHDGSNDQKGSAYDLLLSLGYSKTQAWEELERLAGVASSWQPSSGVQVYSAPDPLQQVRGALSRCAPLTTDELAKVGRLLAPLTEHDRAAQDLYGIELKARDYAAGSQ
ncbi:hypothetical protein [Deinococcus sp.]|uniref:hypothetical protein n=1 Tax=Deinococcus sp. TaxID=47478 RepID=UPI003C7BAC83